MLGPFSVLLNIRPEYFSVFRAGPTAAAWTGLRTHTNIVQLDLTLLLAQRQRSTNVISYVGPINCGILFHNGLGFGVAERPGCPS